jgi:acetyl-CoA acetyltransferase
MPSAEPGFIYPASAAEVLGINPRMLNVVDIGGASPAGMIWRAAAAIQAGMCSAVLCIVADLNRVGDQRVPVISVQREFESPYGNIGANCGYAMIAHRHPSSRERHRRGGIAFRRLGDDVLFGHRRE